jgi:RNA polymerase sigma-70 factor, ECF subfamily
MSTESIFKVSKEPLAQEFEEIFREHSVLVYRTAYSITGSPQDAEDVLQTVFLWLLRRGIPSGFNGNPKGYLYRAAVNASLNIRKSKKREIVNSAADRTGALVIVGESRSKPDIENRLVEAISQLNPRAVEMLVLRYEHNYSDAEIGKMLGTSRGVVAVTLYRARTRLEKLLRASTGDKS